MNKETSAGWKAFKPIIFVCAVLVFFVLGFWIRGYWGESGAGTAAASSEETQTVWTCSMDPQIRQNKPGKCPICGMALIPLSDLSGTAEAVMSFTPEAVKLMEVETTEVQRKKVTADVKLVGKLDYDQTRVKAITSWVPGRIDRLFIDYTGIHVNEGDHMAELYSPELISAQAELLQVMQSAEQINTGSGLIRQSVQETLQSARDKLRLLGVSQKQIEEIEKTGKVLDHLTIYAPIGGVVIEKKADEGMYVQTGTKIYTVADLSELWLMLDAYESDLSWIHYGQEVEFTTEAYPGQVFTATISFVSPVLDEKTRTAKVRAVVDNSDGLLKPDLFVRAVVKAPLTNEGRVMAPDLAGKWICPMHRDVIEEHPGQCPICGMDLVRAETLYKPAEEPAAPPLVIPASAVLITGRKLDRAVVYVQVEGQEAPTFTGREIVLGPRAGDQYIVKEGLMEGEKVVTHGNFKIDSAMQIQAKPSMMTMKDVQGVQASGEQTLCPVMGNPIDKNVFVEYEGKKVYFCCPGCIEKFQAEPEKYLSKLPQFQNKTMNSETTEMEHVH